MHQTLTKSVTKVAIVGGGPTAVYTLKNLLQKSGRYSVTIFEAGKVAGCGIPYSEEHNTPEMMANITSIEIPPVLVSLADWVRARDAKFLKRFGIDREAVGDRDFYPRILLGAYYVDQLRQLMEAGSAAGHAITVETDTHVVDIEPLKDGTSVLTRSGEKTAHRRFDRVILATGHLTDFGKLKRPTRLYRSPYPTQNLTLDKDRAALILGSSLSGIDAVVALASQHGTFIAEGTAFRYEPKGPSPIRLVMTSRKGIIPDADFFYPIPEEPLLIFTPARLEALQAEGKTGFLGRAMKLFKQQLATDDPEFLARLGLKRFTPEAFAKAYFEMRRDRQGFKAIAQNLRESERNYRERRTVMWRYTLMRAHEVFSEIVPYFDSKDLKTFRTHLTPVFADAYGCIPHKSIERLLALHQAGCLDVIALGDSGKIIYRAGAFELVGVEKEQSFRTLIDARGQVMVSLADLGFERLDQAVDVEDFLKRSEGEAAEHQFRVPLRGQPKSDIFCLSIPIMMKRYPFAQGLVACADAAKLVADAI
ncbi:FAD/NAD(P)-binding protein [Devosia sp. Leaf64]|jgi:uncharacterized NAD(P)/FAD-binding protein YdhS|uniref:FAD/NAD(P)-binding protein n=1 Tax=Devosia sp. Leaf64 TaxID=1736229 RepID=UPI0007148B5F|nr:FAD/NAD(P)-binding protein [Devosia sp. Leaf64]KQN72320.1 hypothetical protein ASE94_07310 [Devosia sp. Leaf64]